VIPVSDRIPWRADVQPAEPDALKFFVYPSDWVFENFLRRLAKQVPIRIWNDRTVVLPPDQRDGSFCRFHKLYDTFLDVRCLTDARLFPDVVPRDADYFVVPIVIESNQLQPCPSSRSPQVPNPTPEAAAGDLLAVLPFFNERLASKHIFFFYGDQHVPPQCVGPSQRFLVSCHRASACHALPYHNAAFTRAATSILDAPLAFSFQGQASVNLRGRLALSIHLTSRRPHHVALNRHYFEWYSPEERAGLVKSLRDLMADSRFVLCPRGEGLSSIRLFETMAVGRIPVIIADDAKLPLEDVIDYDRLIVRVPEWRLAELEPALAAFEASHDLEEASEGLASVSESYFRSDRLRAFLTRSLMAGSGALDRSVGEAVGR
jgi:Exostosin family